MNRPSPRAFALALLATGLGAFAFLALVAFLSGQGLDRAEKWVSIAGVVLATLTGALGLALARRTLGTGGQRQGADRPRGSRHRPPSATGVGAVAVGGDVGGDVSTVVSGPVGSVVPAECGDGASGPGATVVAGRVGGSVRTRVERTSGDDAP
jgi:hypothetical protein